MPNKTIYCSDGDLPLFQRAQDLAKGNLSLAISLALHRYVDVEEGKRDGFDEIIVRVGPGSGRKVRFVGVLLAEWLNSDWSRTESIRVYRSRTGKFVLHIERSPEYKMLDSEGKPAGLWGHLGLGNYTYASRAGESTIEVIPTLEELQEKIPPQLFEMVTSAAQKPVIEDLDI